MSVLSTDKNMLTLIYSSESHLGKQVLGYVQGAGDALRTIDIAETNLGHAVWVTIADGLNKELGTLFTFENTDSEERDSSSFDTDDWLKLIDKNPELLQNPIAIKGDNFMQVTNRSEVLKFFEVDSAGLEKKGMDKDPTTQSTTKNESFI